MHCRSSFFVSSSVSSKLNSHLWSSWTVFMSRFLLYSWFDHQLIKPTVPISKNRSNINIVQTRCKKNIADRLISVLVLILHECIRAKWLKVLVWSFAIRRSNSLIQGCWTLRRFRNRHCRSRRPWASHYDQFLNQQTTEQRPSLHGSCQCSSSISFE